MIVRVAALLGAAIFMLAPLLVAGKSIITYPILHFCWFGLDSMRSDTSGSIRSGL